MEDLKVIFASNLIALRTKANMTQAELASRINYSDKSVSKWERTEAIPDVAVVKAIADIFGVSVDYMLQSHDQWESGILKAPIRRDFDEKMVIKVSVLAVWTLAVLLFVIFWIMDMRLWIIFVAAVPASLVVLLVLNTLWNDRRHNKLIVGGIVFGCFAVTYFALWEFNPWQLVFVLAPAELLVAGSYRISGKKRPERPGKRK